MANFGNFMKKKLAGKFDAPGEPEPRIISSNIGFRSQPQPERSDSSSASESEDIGWGERVEA